MTIQLEILCVFFSPGICLSSKTSSMITSVLPTPIPIPVQVITPDRQQSSEKKLGKLLLSIVYYCSHCV